MKFALLIGAGVGYVLGARAGRERYEQIVRLARKIGGSQTVQSTAGVLQAQVDEMRAKAMGAVTSKVSGKIHSVTHFAGANGTANGHSSATVNGRLH